MINFSQVLFKGLGVHRVGNKHRDEGILLADHLYTINDDKLQGILFDYFFTPFNNDEFYAFRHDTDLSLNEIYRYAQAIFADKNSLLDQSSNIAKHLYGQSTHPKVSGGELYVAYFTDCLLGDEIVEAIGIFKSESKDTYLKPMERNNELIISYEVGINVKKLDKGCLIFNTLEQEGYRMLVVDKQNRGGGDAQYWLDNFLCAERVHDRAFVTQNYIELCRAFCDDISETLEGKKEEVLFMNKALNYFSGHKSFDLDEFADEVIEDGSRIVEFKKFKEQFEEETGLLNDDSFKISPSAVRQMKRKFKNLIRLDSGIDIKLSGSDAEPFIRRGYDEDRKLNYYTIYFENEE